MRDNNIYQNVKNLRNHIENSNIEYIKRYIEELN